MKRGRVWTTTDDVRVTPVVSIAKLERVSHHGIDFILPLRIAGGSPRALVRFGTDVDRVLENAQLHRRLYQSHLREDGPGVLDTVARGCTRPFSSKALLLFVFTTLTLPGHEHKNSGFSFSSGVEYRCVAIVIGQRHVGGQIRHEDIF